MKKIVLLLFLASFNNCYAALFGVTAEYVKQKTTEIKTSFQSEITGVKGDMSAIKGDVSGVKSNIGELELKIGQINNTLSAKIVGLDKSISSEIKAGRDVITTNDTTLMMYIVKGLVGLCSSLIVILGWCLKTLLRREKEKKFYKEQTLLNVKSEEELLRLRDLHNAFVKRGKK